MMRVMSKRRGVAAGLVILVFVAQSAGGGGGVKAVPSVEELLRAMRTRGERFDRAAAYAAGVPFLEALLDRVLPDTAVPAGRRPTQAQIDEWIGQLSDA